MRRTLTALMVVAIAGIACAQVRYEVQKLRDQNGNRFEPAAFCDDGSLAGSAKFGSNYSAALWKGGQITRLSQQTDTAATGYASGTAVGGGRAGADRGALVWRDGIETRLQGLNGGSSIGAYDINASGLIVGEARGNRGSEPTIWIDGQPKGLGYVRTGQNQGWANAVNSSGVVVGSSSHTEGTDYRAFVWDAQNGIRQIPGSRVGEGATDINDLGWITSSGDISQAVLYRDGQRIVLSDDGSASALNNNGDVVGNDWFTNEGARAVIWTGGQTIRLDAAINQSGWVLEYAGDINDAGQILTYGYYNGGLEYVVLTPVPEPAILAALGFGILPLVLRRRRR